MERIKEGAQIKESRKRKEPDDDQLEPSRIPEKVRKLEKAVRALFITEKKERPPEGSELEPTRSPAVILKGIIVRGTAKRPYRITRIRHLKWLLKTNRYGLHEELRIVGIEEESGSIKEKELNEMFGEWLNEKEDRTIVCTRQELKERYGARSNKRGAVC